MNRRFSVSRLAVLLACLAACCVLGIYTVVLPALNRPAVDPAIVAADPDVRAVAADPDVRAVAAANTDFGFRLLHRLATDQPTGNVFFSPLSVSAALTMTLNGAGGTTQRDMAKALGLGAMTREQINHANGLLLPSLADPDPKVEVSVANALWANKGVTLAPDFQERCRRFYDARAESLDFGSPVAVGTINDWVGQNIQGKITDLVNQADIDQATAVLTNAIYFHGLWQTPFDKAATQDAPFTLAGGGVRTVPMMRREGGFPYSETPEGQAVSLPYGDGRMSLYVLLPNAGQTADGLAESLDARAWADKVAGMRPTRLTLYLPRFKAAYSGRLKGPLSSLGMASAFGSGADFGPMGLGDSFIGDVIHKAVVEVDEEGTVAAAATAVSVGRSLDLPPPTVMRVDRPFFMAIRDNATGTVLFEGVIRDPQ